jgi:hypothetical protein
VPTAGTAVTALGVRPRARDVLLGAGTWRANSNGGAAEAWLSACVLADAFDAVAVLRHFHALPPRRRTLALILSLAPALTGARIARISS